MSEIDYKMGMRQAYVNILTECLKHLGVDDPLTQGAGWVKERAELVIQLRSLCKDHGDNDWPDDLYLPDVIEKHLARHLERG